MQLTLKSILNFKERHSLFIYKDIRLIKTPESKIEISIIPRKKSKAVCSGCGHSCSGYDTLPERLFHHVPIHGIPLIYKYSMRRVDCPSCGVTVETVPWAQGKSPVTNGLAWFLSQWAKTLSLEEVARAFKFTWHHVFTAVAMTVAWGRERMDLSNITAIGVDEIYWAKSSFMTVVYQIDNHCKRLLWAGEKRTEESFNKFFDFLTDARCESIKFVCSDMWKPYLNVIKARAKNALNILDRFHIAQKLSKAIDEVRAQETRALIERGKDVVLKHSRWCFLKNPINLTTKQKVKLKELVSMNLKSVRAYLLKEDFQHFWSYASPTWAEKFLESWCTQAMRSRLDPMKKVAKTIRSHKLLILNWFQARNEISLGCVEGLNNKAKVVIRKSYGFRVAEVQKIMLYHKLGKLPVHELAHKYF